MYCFFHFLPLSLFTTLSLALLYAFSFMFGKLSDSTKQGDAMDGLNSKNTPRYALQLPD